MIRHVKCHQRIFFSGVIRARDGAAGRIKVDKLSVLPPMRQQLIKPKLHSRTINHTVYAIKVYGTTWKITTAAV